MARVPKTTKNALPPAFANTMTGNPVPTSPAMNMPKPVAPKTLPKPVTASKLAGGVTPTKTKRSKVGTIKSQITSKLPWLRGGGGPVNG